MYHNIKEVATKGMLKTLLNRVGQTLKFLIMKTKELMISEILADKSKQAAGTTHCSNCGHCVNTL
ncbi:hypothetical protein KUL113_30020 [Tenacibaculum sp. KUL113]|nr:hypothetical protein BACY1_31750 [Tenacibaculum mesophilum]GFD73582.1 hypothetical protein KUL113_30020 [Tenacibaculum sp. KUL113]